MCDNIQTTVKETSIRPGQRQSKLVSLDNNLNQNNSFNHNTTCNIYDRNARITECGNLRKNITVLIHLLVFICEILQLLNVRNYENQLVHLLLIFIHTVRTEHF